MSAANQNSLKISKVDICVVSARHFRFSRIEFDLNLRILEEKVMVQVNINIEQRSRREKRLLLLMIRYATAASGYGSKVKTS